ncbi:MAG: hypothetical protein PHU43_09320 [Candidatus Bipolaricaulis sp.]|nr:hypothetical protein [Candidatus Bipolaricaulis sp.]
MVRRRIPRRWSVALWIAGALALSVGGLGLALVLSAPSPPAALASAVPPKEIPASWVSSEEPAADPRAARADEPAPGLAMPYTTAGTLALFANGKPFGEETYELRIADEGTTLTSSGRFWLKVVLVTARVAFEQTLKADSNLRPTSHVAQFHAPLGMDRSIRAAVAGDRFLVERSGKEEEIEVDRDRAFTLGTFSTYALLPHLFALRQKAGSASFQILMLGGPPSQEAGASPVMAVQYAGPARLVAGESVLGVDRDRISSAAGDSDLYARGAEFLAFRADTEDNALWVCRADLFPNGVEVVDDGPPSAP